MIILTSRPSRSASFRRSTALQIICDALMGVPKADHQRDHWTNVILGWRPRIWPPISTSSYAGFTADRRLRHRAGRPPVHSRHDDHLTGMQF